MSFHANSIPEETANRIMMREGSAKLHRRLMGMAEPSAFVRPHVPYVPVSDRPEIPVPAVIGRILAATAEAFGLEVEEMLAPSRVTYLGYARAVAYRLMRDRKWKNGEPTYSLSRIAGFVRRDHTTIMHALKQFETYCRRHPEIAARYAELSERFAA